MIYPVREYHGDPGPSTTARQNFNRQDKNQSVRPADAGYDRKRRTSFSRGSDLSQGGPSPRAGAERRLSAAGKWDGRSGGRPSNPQSGSFGTRPRVGPPGSFGGSKASTSGGYVGRSNQDQSTLSGDRNRRDGEDSRQKPFTTREQPEWKPKPMPRWKMDPELHGRAPRANRSAPPSDPSKRQFGLNNPNRPAQPSRPAPFYNQLPRSARPTGHQSDAYETSKRITEWIRDHPSPIKPWEVDELLRLVMDAPRYRMNTVCWNQVIALLGKEHKLETMFRSLNHMKKRNYQPNSRTYTIMLNAYAGARHMDSALTFNPAEKPTERKWQRILSIYNESQANISACITQLQTSKEKQPDAELGLAGETDLTEEDNHQNQSEKLAELRQQINVMPTNAYLKLLGRWGMWAQMEKVHVAMDTEGQLSPNARTYTILLDALLNRRAQQNERRYAHAKDDLPTIMTPDEFGNTARTLWDEAVRRFHPAVPPEDFKPDPERQIDEELALLAMRAFLSGRPADQRLATGLIPYIWDLPEPTSALPASMTASMSAKSGDRRSDVDIPHYMREIPRLKPTVRSASSLLVMLGRANKVTLAATWARHFISLPELRSKMDFQFVRSVIHALGSDGDIEKINEVMEQYQPPTGKGGYHVYIWENALMAARQRADFPAALDAFRRMTHLPWGTEDGVPKEQRKPYVWTRPGGKEADPQGHQYYKPDPIAPTAKTLSLLFKAAFGAKAPDMMDRNSRKAFNVFTAFPMSSFFTIPESDYKRGKTLDLMADSADAFEGEIHSSLVHAAEWRLALAKDVARAIELMLERAQPAEKRPLWELKEKMIGIGRTWGELLDPKMRGRLIGNPAALVSEKKKGSEEYGMPARGPAKEQAEVKEADEGEGGLEEEFGMKEEDWEDEDGELEMEEEEEVVVGGPKFRKNTVKGRTRPQ